MSWQMPTAGPWNSGMAMAAPDMASMGSYTPEQWAAMQHQNWQQWAQWQQQYAQWQSQYGEKYAEQMQAIQAMGGMPPLPPPSTAPPPAPPPPDQPPPPPPHENNQPLFGQPVNKPAPVPPPTTTNQRNKTSSNLTTINTNAHVSVANVPNWAYGQEATQPNQTSQAAQNQASSVNSEALKKLAEEERLFDIQFQKWEEEIEKWKRDNVNHPDKQAYKEYEQKFEACRAQLLERRQQMKQKRARLLSNTPATTQPNTAVAGNVTTSVPPNLNNTNRNAYSNKQSQNYQNYSDQGNTQYLQQHNAPKTTYNRNSNKNIDPQDRYESYQTTSDNSYQTTVNTYSTPIASDFLPTSGNSKGIPGLDLVPDADKPYAANATKDVIDITDDNPHQPKGPDYNIISKGINNILGDEKIMNILSMVRGQTSKESSISNPPSMNAPTGPFNNQNNAPYGQGNRNQNYNNNQQYDNRQNMPYNRQGPGSNYPMQQQQGPHDKRMHDNMPQDQYEYDRNMQYGGNDMGYSYENRPPNVGPTHGPPHGAPHGGPPHGGPSHGGPPHGGPSHGGPPHGGPPHGGLPHGGPPHSGPPYGGPPPARPSMPQTDSRPPIRPLMQETINHPNANEYPRGPVAHERQPLVENNMNVNPMPLPKQPVRPQWIDEPMFTPSLIVEYEHKPLRLKARDFIEPVHMFDYNHKSKDGDVKKKDFEREVDELFVRKPRRDREESGGDRYMRDHYSRDYERRAPPAREELRREDLRDELRLRGPPRDDYDDRRRTDSRYDDRRRDDRDKYSRREDSYRERDRDFHRDRDRGRDVRRDEVRHRSRSRDRDSRKRGLSRESDDHSSTFSKKSKDKDDHGSNGNSKHIVMIDDLLESPGRTMRPEKIVIILRGPPGSGKSYLAKLIRDREAEYGGTVRIMSIDDYFMQEGEVEEKDPTTGKMVKKPTLKYEYDESYEETYMNSLKRAFKRTLTDGYFTFLIFDAVNDQLKSYADVWNFARQTGFQVYICTMELDPQVCYKRNIHNRKLEDIEVICARFFPTPAHHIQLDATTLLQSAAITEVQMEDAVDDVIIEEDQEKEVESVFTSKWEKMDDAAQLARLDGTSKPLRPSQLSMEDYLQLDDWTPSKAQPGKKTVRWADIEERRQQEKMRAIGFVVGQTDWNRMTDPTMGSSALTQTKYIERVRRN